MSVSKGQGGRVGIKEGEGVGELSAGFIHTIIFSCDPSVFIMYYIHIYIFKTHV